MPLEFREGRHFRRKCIGFVLETPDSDTRHEIILDDPDKL